MPKFNFEDDFIEDEMHCGKCGSTDYEVEDTRAYCSVCNSPIIFQEKNRHIRKGKNLKKARFRE